MENNKLTLKSPEAYVELCLEQISREVNMASVSQEFSSSLVEGLQEIQTITKTGLRNKSISVRKKALKEIGQQAFYLEEPSLSEKEATCLQRIQGHVGRGLNAELELANAKSQILNRRNASR